MSLLDIDQIVKYNKEYRVIILTNGQMQIVAMNLAPGQTIPLEVHYTSSQFIKVEEGGMIAEVGGYDTQVQSGSSIVIPPGTQHKITAGFQGAKLYTIYSPPVHTVVNGTKFD